MELMLWLEGGRGSWQAATGLQQEQSKACRGLYERAELEGGANNWINTVAVDTLTMLASSHYFKARGGWYCLAFNSAPAQLWTET